MNKSYRQFFNYFRQWKGGILLLLSGIGAFCAWVGATFSDEIKSALNLQNAEVVISAGNPRVEINKKIDLEARVNSVGYQNLAPGVFSLIVNHEYVTVKPKISVKLDAISGTTPVDVPEIKVIRMPPGRLTISATYVSGSLEIRSNELVLEIIPPELVIHPHFDRSDTGRVNLSGKWNIVVGGVTGTMTLRQGTDNKIYGNYEIPGGKWQAGEITGFKDGKTFRVQFSVPGREKSETIRVAGYFEIQGANGDYIEVTGCAYHLRRAKIIYDTVGMEGVDCKSPTKYDHWKVLQTASFYAASPFDKQE
ncbi:hypothetical protein [Pseudomonas sp. B33.4]|uniref:hypothetical protein n=1 Tax=Pseudomonas sp. B33.4 TaxID=3104265 RepID=UPI002ADECD7F|nr:hypothetical protein [Pseudomonas sp. B33.4]